MITATCMKCGRIGDLDTFEHILCYGMVCTEGYGCAIPPSENTCVCCGEVIPEGRHVCVKCEGVAITLPPMTLDEKKDAPVDTGTLKHPIDIHKIIDDAMEKRDRTVSIYIGESGVSVNVSPYEDEKAKWIYQEDSEYRYNFECSNCGMTSEFHTAYCPSCGEQMHGVKRVEEV